MVESNTTIRVRIAPSPTGKFHIGTARTALFNFLYAKKHDGKFIVRMEDTDRERSKEEYSNDILEGMKWLGFTWDEGPDVGGPFKPYFQKDRAEIYKKYIDQLLYDKKAYRCYCTPEELEKERKAQQKRGEAPRYNGKCRHLSEAEREKLEKSGKPSVVRFAVDPGKVEFDDLVRGHVEFQAELFGDFVIVRSDGSPLFLLTNVIDDSLMEITHVLRGEDHLSNTAKQLLLAQALRFFSPQFGHFPLILNTDRSKMSKRKNPVSISDDYRAKGYLPEAMVNFMVLLGWSSGTDQEIYSLHQLINEFQIERVGKSPSIFDIDKLTWMNGYYIRHLPIGDLATRAQEFITDKKILEETKQRPDYYMQAVALIQDRLKLLSETEELIEYFFKAPVYKAELLVAKKSDKARTKQALTAAKQALTEVKSFVTDEVEIALRRTAKDHQLNDGEMLWAVRVALSGLPASPGVFELLEVFGREESLKRLEFAISKLK